MKPSPLALAAESSPPEPTEKASRGLFLVPVITRPADSHQSAHLPDRQSWLALRRLHHLPDFGKDGVAPAALGGGFNAATCGKAPRKKESSNCCLPTSRSSSAI